MPAIDNTLPAAACTEAEADSLLERGETAAPAPTRSLRRVAAFALAGVGALSCVLYIAGTGNHRVLAWGRRSAPSVISKADFEGYAAQYSQAEAAGSQLVAAASSQLNPPEDMSDGSKCGDDEEDFAMACYKKCSILTNGVAPVRTSPWSCCASAHCRLNEERINVKLCAGYDVAGDKEGKDKCPHKEGLCYENEELHLGLCYKKCSILTNGAYIHRKSAITCCNNPNLLQCIPFLNPKNTDTSTHYSVGGGKGDGDATTIATPHAPIEALAERTLAQSS
jgi:hypothetical protein